MLFLLRTYLNVSYGAREDEDWPCPTDESEAVDALSRQTDGNKEVGKRGGDGGDRTITPG